MHREPRVVNFAYVMDTRDMLFKCLNIFQTKDSSRTAREGAEVGSFMLVVMSIPLLDGPEPFMEVFTIISSAFEDVYSMKYLKFLG